MEQIRHLSCGGGYHGIGQIIESAIIKKDDIKQRSKGIKGILRTLCVFAFAALGWIFFVSNSLEDAVYAITHLFTGISSPVSYLKDGFKGIGLNKKELIKVVFWLFILALYDLKSIKDDTIKWLGECKIVTRWIIYVFLIVLLFLFAKTSENTFVYFQF